MIRVSIASSPSNADDLAELRKYLAMLRRQGAIEIVLGLDPMPDLVLLILTVELLSEEALEETLEQIRAFGEAGGAVCVILPRPVPLHRGQVDKRKPLWYEDCPRLPFAGGRDQNGRMRLENPDGIPISTWSEPATAWTEVSREVRDLVVHLESKRA